MKAIRKWICLFSLGSIDFERLNGKWSWKTWSIKYFHANTKKKCERIKSKEKFTYSSLVSFSRNPLANGLLTIFNWVTWKIVKSMSLIYAACYTKTFEIQMKISSEKSALKNYHRKCVSNVLCHSIWRIQRSGWLLFLIFALIAGLNLNARHCRHRIDKSSACVSRTIHVVCVFLFRMPFFPLARSVLMWSNKMPPNSMKWSMIIKKWSMLISHFRRFYFVWFDQMLNGHKSFEMAVLPKQSSTLIKSK